MQRTYPRAGSNGVPVPGSVCSTQTTRSPAARTPSTRRATSPAMPGLEMAGHSGCLAERFLDVDDDKSTSHDYNHRPGQRSRVRQDQVPHRTDPVT